METATGSATESRATVTGTARTGQLNCLESQSAAVAAIAAAARAKLLPGLMKRAKENLKTPPQEYTQAAIRQMQDYVGQRTGEGLPATMDPQERQAQIAQATSGILGARIARCPPKGTSADRTITCSGFSKSQTPRIAGIVMGGKPYSIDC
jgi:hypothetical protein